MVLNEKQKTLLDMVEKEKYILVKAPAGTGKTFCSIQCAKRYIEKNKEFNKNFQKVLVITFSKNARAQLVKELKNEESIIPYVEITNYHSFIKKYIEIYKNLIGIKKEISIVEGERINKYINQAGLEEKDLKEVPNIINNFSIEENKKINGNCKYNNIKKAKELIDRIIEYTNETGEICFEEFGYLFNRILLKCKGLSSYISQHYPMVILDEYQDTDYYQNEFLNKILIKSNGIFFADDLQMIYEFRGAKKERLKKKKKTYPSIKTIMFDEIFRYRDKKDIIELLYKIRHGEQYNYDKLVNGKCINVNVKANETWRNSKSKKAQLTVISQYVYWNISKIISEELKKGKSIAILCREKSEVKKIKDIFIKNSYHVKQNKDSNELLKIASSLKEIILPEKIDDNKGNYIYLALMATNKDEIDGKENIKDIKIDRVRSGLLLEIKNIMIDFKEQRDLNSKLDCIESIISILKENDYEINYSILFFIKRCLKNESITNEKIDKIMLSRQYINSYSNISKGLYIMTMHQSKGKEFDNVFIIDTDNIKKETNLSYVAHSRMKEKIYPIKLIYEGTNWNNKKQK